MSGDVGRYRRVRSRLWLERPFQSLTEGEQLVLLYVLTGPYSNGLGLFRMSVAAAAEDLPRISRETFKRRFDAARAAMGWRYDPSTSVLWIPSWLEENAPQSPNVVKSWRSAFNEVPDCPIKAEAGGVIQAFLKAKGQAFSEAFGEVLFDVVRGPFPIREQEQEHVREQELEHSPALSPLQVHGFLKTFCEKYKAYRGATYQVQRPRDVANAKRLLKTFTAARLGEMADLLLNTNDPWISDTDRGVGILSVKASWLDSQLAAIDRAAGPPPTVWDTVLAHLRTRLPRHDFHRWFASTSLMNIDGTTLLVSVETSDQAGWIQRHYASQLTEALAAAGVESVSFHVQGRQTSLKGAGL